MNDLLMPHLARAGLAGLIHIDVGQVLGRLRAAGQGPMDRYLVACAAVQFWADLLAVGTSEGALMLTTSEEIQRQLRRAEGEADHAAQALLGKAAATPALADEPADEPASVHVALRGDAGPDALGKLLHLPMPECCGYDLADLELIAGDGRRLSGQVGLERPVLIVGIRTGGSYLAPLWKAVLGGLGVADVHWCTVRPQVGGAAVDGLPTAQAWLGRRRMPVVVVVDDQPDSGATMDGVAALLRAPGVELYFSSVGKLWRGAAARPGPANPPAVIVRDGRPPRLWQCLLPAEHPGFIARLRDTPGLPALPAQLRLQLRCPQGEARYGLGRAWLPWNAPGVLNGRRSLVNPRKTPLEICGADGKVLLHLRFVGAGVFGRAEFQRVRQMDGAPPAWFVDGYAVTLDIGAARPFREQFHAASPSARGDLLVQAANCLTAQARQVVAHAPYSPMLMALGSRWTAIVELMRERCGGNPLLQVPEPLNALLAQPAPWPGRTGKAIRSSLRYSCGDWHWQVDRQGRLHRFQQEANWGDVSFPELELAAFALENRLALADARHLASLCNLAYSSVQESLSLAALMIAEARVRSVRTLSDAGRGALCQDFQQLIKTSLELAGLDTPSSWK
ncbi:hypothetical protein ACFOLJ_12180 [Rugamonas sp. CCM 8940]|uniref:hypothetical protein n=1 Tax=Rugamonas sp. CCM 8940 TaxID=2765359 RepID=UPI0018F4D28C|nr:hypothetical protein [Rugamonas sp. CCM 8940]MBJ7311502.1 hypothetical protein [Rugamonas sp. CCM 8940]